MADYDRAGTDRPHSFGDLTKSSIHDRPETERPEVRVPTNIGDMNLLVVVDAGNDLDTPRPASAAAVLWQFDAGTDVGTGGANVTNGLPGDIYVVKAS